MKSLRKAVFFILFFVFASCPYEPLWTPNYKPIDTDPPEEIEGVLRADSSKDVYQLIKDCGYNYEVPEDDRWANHHTVKHLRQIYDPFLERDVFAFDICHNSTVIDIWLNSTERDKAPVSLLNDKQIDRQRNEIKTDNGSPEWGKARLGDSVTYRWKFKLPEGFVASASFTHIHQLKPVDGDDSMPTITLTVVKRTGQQGQEMQLRYSDGQDSSLVYLLQRIPLGDFLDEWILVEEKVYYHDTEPEFEFCAARMRDGRFLMEYIYDSASWSSSSPFRMIRDNSFVRPKWGIYRGILSGGNPVTGPLRDETVLFADFEIVAGSITYIQD